MILNIFGPSGSGKTSFIRNLLEKRKIKLFFETFSKEKTDNNLNNKISISLIHIPIFRGSIKEFFNI